MEGFQTFKGSGRTAYRRASLNLYLHAKFQRNRRNFLWKDGHNS